MSVRIDTKDLEKLERGLSQYKAILPKNVASSELRKSAKPLLQKVKQTVPVGESSGERISLRKARNARAKNVDPNYYRRGGATRKDVRMKSVEAEGTEIARVIVGVSKARGKVGWRTRFITEGTKERKKANGASTGRVKANDFLQRALDATFITLAPDFREKTLEAFQKWAKKYLPQGRF